MKTLKLEILSFLLLAILAFSACISDENNNPKSTSEEIVTQQLVKTLTN